tara:strand:+ start:23596 stop:23967 length:372 start_codon:yes stop_codon:yes gene_type:complete
VTEEKKPAILAMPKSYVDEILEETEEQKLISLDLIKDMTSEASLAVSSHVAMPIVAQLIWLNYSIIQSINVEIKDPIYHTNEDTGEEEYIFAERTIHDLQSLMLARYYAVSELMRLSHSVSLH